LLEDFDVVFFVIGLEGGIVLLCHCAGGDKTGAQQGNQCEPVMTVFHGAQYS